MMPVTIDAPLHLKEASNRNPFIVEVLSITVHTYRNQQKWVAIHFCFDMCWHLV